MYFLVDSSDDLLLIDRFSPYYLSRPRPRFPRTYANSVQRYNKNCTYAREKAFFLQK